MPLVVVVVGVAVVVSYLRGGRLRRVPDAELRQTWLLFAGLAVQLFVDVAAERAWVGDTTGYLLLLASQLLVFGFILANWWRPGIGLIALGLLMNALVIGANGAMPVDVAAIEQLGVENVQVPPGKHEPMTDDTRLAWLGDVYPVSPIRTIVSLGDVVLALGLVPFVHHLMTYRTAAERRGGRRRRERQPAR